MTRVLIRCQLGGDAGLGHASRMRALATALTARGAEVHFLTQSPALASFVSYPCHLLGEFALSGRDILIFDMKGPLDDIVPWYATYTDYLDGKIVLIDRPDIDGAWVNLSILPNAHQSQATLSRLRQTFGTRLLAGWDYVLLEDEVTRQAPIPYRERVAGPIVFCAGGSDPTQALATMWRCSERLLPAIQKFFLIGTLAQQPRSVVGAKDYETTHPWRWHWPGQAYPWQDGPHYPMPFVREHLREAALVVTLFGQTCYEALWWQTPTLCLAHTDENSAGARALTLASGGAVRYIGSLDPQHPDHTTPAAFCNNIQHAWDISRQAQHAASAGLFDGQGVQRVADAILRLL